MKVIRFAFFLFATQIITTSLPTPLLGWGGEEVTNHSFPHSFLFITQYFSNFGNKLF